MTNNNDLKIFWGIEFKILELGVQLGGKLK